jgi:hypothetical protein
MDKAKEEIGLTHERKYLLLNFNGPSISATTKLPSLLLQVGHSLMNMTVSEYSLKIRRAKPRRINKVTFNVEASN